MHPEQFLDRLEHHQIVEAIKAAERNTTGEVRLFISHGKAPDPMAAAKKHFEMLKMHRHPHRNAILIYVAPRSQTFAIVGDQQIHKRLGDQAWQALAGEMSRHFKSGRPMEAITTAIQQAGAALAEHFPREK